MSIETNNNQPWNKGKLVSQKLPFNIKEIWAIRVRLQIAEKKHDLALFNLAINSKLRGNDFAKIKVSDEYNSGVVSSRAIVIQQKTGRPVQFEITANTRDAIAEWISSCSLTATEFLFPSRVAASPHITTRQYARIVDGWLKDIGLASSAYGTHSLRRTKPTFIYKKTQNLRAVQLLLGHTKLESTVRYLGIEVEDALEIAEQAEI